MKRFGVQKMKIKKAVAPDRVPVELWLMLGNSGGMEVKYLSAYI